MRVDDCRAGNFQCNEDKYEDGFSITFVMSEEEVNVLLAGYDPNSSKSPTDLVSLSIAKPIAEALRQKL